MAGTHVVTAFLRNGPAVLLTRRSDEVGTYRGHWAGISGYAEGDPDEQVRTEIREEIGLDEDDITLVRAGDPIDVHDTGRDDEDRHWVVRPYLFDTSTREVTPNEELAAIEWLPPTAIRDPDRQTVPGLWDAYDRVRPRVETIRDDREHGSAYLSIRALDVLRDDAALTNYWPVVVETARRLRDARGDMVVIRNRVNRAMATALDEGRTPEAVVQAAEAVAATALRADRRAASEARVLVDGARVATISRSGTVLDALDAGDPRGVVIATSHPGGEGIGVASELADAGVAVTLTSDANLPTLVADCDIVLVGADAVHPDGRVVNKVGTRALALGADEAGVPFYAICATDKVDVDARLPDEAADLDGSFGDIGDAAGDQLDVENPLFDGTPGDLVTGVVTERGRLDSAEIRSIAAEHRAAARWDVE